MYKLCTLVKHTKMFEITTRLPNSFAFKNHPKHLLHQNNKFSSIFTPLNGSYNRNNTPIYFGQTATTSSNPSSFSSNHNYHTPRHQHATMSSSSYTNSSPFIYEHTGSGNGSEIKFLTFMRFIVY